MEERARTQKQSAHFNESKSHLNSPFYINLIKQIHVVIMILQIQ
jgi:hypothetical protein